MRKSVFGGKGRGEVGVKPPSLIIYSGRFILALSIFLHLVYELEFNFILERNAKKMSGKIEK